MAENTTSWVAHPGEYIREELEARNLSQRDLAFILGCPEQSLTLILNGKRGVSVEMAKQLAHAFDVSPELFVNLQRAYDLAHAQEPNPDIAKRAELSQYPMREMIGRGWLVDGSAAELQQQLANLFGTAIGEIPYMPHAAKRTNYEKRGVTPAQLAWMFRVKKIAEAMPVPKYSAETLLKAVEQMKPYLVAPGYARNVPKLLAEAGVRFVIVEHLAKSKIDGVALWLNENSPVIGLSSRLDRIDNFWFVLRHEIEHILRKHGQGSGNEMIDDDVQGKGANISEEERIANEAAMAFCAPSEKIDGFIKRQMPFFREQRVLEFSALYNIHPGIVVGQIQHKTGRYDLLRKHLVKIRQFVLPGAMVDGWGQPAPI